VFRRSFFSSSSIWIGQINEDEDEHDWVQTAAEVEGNVAGKRRSRPERLNT
jgi:hypothetical protein